MLSLGYVDHPLNDCFARGDELDAWTLEYLQSGCIRVKTLHGQATYKAPYLMLIPPHASYRVEWAGGPRPWAEIYAIFDAPRDWSTLLQWPTSETGLGVIDLHDSAIAQEVDTAMKEALHIFRSTRVNRQQLTLNAFEKVMLLLDEVNPCHGRTQRDARIEKTLSFIAENYSKEIDIETLSRQAFLSPSRFSHLFKEQMGAAPMAYLEQYRLERAAEKLLATHDSIEYVSSDVGFANAFYFSTRFRKHFGRSPSQYRRNPK